MDERSPERVRSRKSAYNAAIYVLRQGCESREDLFNTLGSLTAYFGENMDADELDKFRPDDSLKWENPVEEFESEEGREGDSTE